jgi:hypothetical protein
MGLENIQTLFRRGKYKETILAVETSQFNNEEEEFTAHSLIIV